jgi:hypothetical protein
MTSLIDILLKKVDPRDVLTLERKVALAEALNKLPPKEAKSVYSVILSYKLTYDTVRRVGDSESDIPYYGTDEEAGIKLSLDLLPDQLILILEKLLETPE